MSRVSQASQVVGLFLVTGLCEIGGGYLIWGAIRDRRPAWWAVAGSALLVLYGVVAARQPATFGRAYAAYGGVFVALSVGWGWGVDGVRPDRFDLIGSAVCLVGVAIIAFAPRG